MISVDEVNEQLAKAQASKPATKPNRSRELSIDEVQSMLPQPKATKAEIARDALSDAGDALRDIGGKIKGVAKAEWDDMGRAGQTYSKYVHSYLEELKKDRDANPEGWGPQVLQSLKTFNDAGALAWAAIGGAPVVQEGLVKPIQQSATKVGDLIKGHLDDRAAGKGVDWAVHKRDVETAVDTFNQSVDAAANAGLMFLGPKGKGLSAGKEAHAAGEELAATRQQALDTEPKSGEPPPPPVAPKPRVQVVTGADGKPKFRQVSKGEASAQVTSAMKELEGDTVKRGSMISQSGQQVQQLAKEWAPHEALAMPKFAEAYTSGKPIKAHDLLDHISQANTGLPKEVLERLRAYVDDVDIRVVDAIKDKEGNPLPWNGSFSYSRSGRTPSYIELKYRPYDGGNMTRTLAHEITHAATTRFLDANPNHPLAKELQTLWEEAHARLAAVKRKHPATKDVSFYGLSDVHEFIAEAMSNPNFQRFLATSAQYASKNWPTTMRNLYDRLADIVGRMFGKTPAQAQLLHRTLKVTEDVMKEHEEMLHPEMEEQLDWVSHASKEELPGEKKLAGWIDQLQQLVSVESLGPAAKEAASVIAHRQAVSAHNQRVWSKGQMARQRFWDTNPEKINDFIDKFEAGGKFDDPHLEMLRQHYRIWARNIFKQDQSAGVSYEPQENYLPHLFKDNDAVEAYFTHKYGTKWGTPGFIKDRSFALIAEARKAGFELKYRNPEEMMQARQIESDRVELQSSLLRDMEQYGLAVRKGEKVERPQGWAPRRSPNGNWYYVDPHAAAVIHNAFDSYSFWSDPKLAGAAYRGLANVKNRMVGLRLMISGFHPIHVVGIDSAAGMTRALEGGGSAPARLKDFLQSGLLYKSLWQNPRAGGRIVRAFDNKIAASEMTETDRENVQYMLEGGFIPRLDSIYKVQGERTILEAARNAMRGKVWQLPDALLVSMRKPIFDVWIPQLKAESYVRDVRTALMRDPSLQNDPMKRMLAFRRIAKSVDNRYGEMQYNNLFWNKAFKDIATLNMLSLGWNLGFIREYGGAAVDIGKALKAPSGAMERGDLHRPLFVAAYTTQALALGGLMTWALSGEIPKDWKDYVYPRTGDKNPDGSDHRVNTMYYTREWASLAKHMQSQGVWGGLGHIAESKGSGLFGSIYEWSTNLDSFNREISNPSDPFWKRTAQKIAYEIGDLEPISVQYLLSETGIKNKALAVAGFTPAPGYATQTKTEAMIMESYHRYVAPASTPYDRAQYSNDMKVLRALEQAKDPSAVAQLNAMKEKYSLNSEDEHKLRKQLKDHTPAPVRMFQRLPWTEQKKLLDQMDPDERQIYLPKSNKHHLRKHYRPPE